MKKNTAKEVKESKQPTLVCQVTGIARKTSQVYLEQKARKIAKPGAKNLDNAIEKFKENYANRDVIRMLHEGKSVVAIRKELGSSSHEPISEDRLEQLLKYNGKHAAGVKVKGKKVNDLVAA